MDLIYDFNMVFSNYWITKIKIQPSNKDFLEIQDYKSVLEKNLVD